MMCVIAAVIQEAATIITLFVCYADVVYMAIGRHKNKALMIRCLFLLLRCLLYLFHAAMRAGFFASAMLLFFVFFFFAAFAIYF